MPCQGNPQSLPQSGLPLNGQVKSSHRTVQKKLEEMSAIGHLCLRLHQEQNKSSLYQCTAGQITVSLFRNLRCYFKNRCMYCNFFPSHLLFKIACSAMGSIKQAKDLYICHCCLPTLNQKSINHILPMGCSLFTLSEGLADALDTNCRNEFLYRNFFYKYWQ